MLAVIDYGVGNLFSLGASLSAIGEPASVTGDAEMVKRADALILPGVGAFADAAEKLRATGLDRVICEEAAAGKPLLGICVGMQLLFETSLEFGEHRGLGLLPGTVRSLRVLIGNGLKLPHIGWNTLTLPSPRHPLFSAVSPGDHVYFVHSFFASDCTPCVIAQTDYGAPFAAAVARGNVMGVQFHPEKSGPVGLSILKSFCEEARK